jgi:hypothetical protein
MKKKTLLLKKMRFNHPKSQLPAKKKAKYYQKYEKMTKETQTRIYFNSISGYYFI